MIVYGKTEQETIELTAESFGIPLAEAEYLLAIARGEVSGKFAIPAKMAPVSRKRVGLAAASRKTLERQKEERQKDEASDTRGVATSSGSEGSHTDSGKFVP
jgi:hypothetical protein